MDFGPALRFWSGMKRPVRRSPGMSFIMLEETE